MDTQTNPAAVAKSAPLPPAPLPAAASPLGRQFAAYLCRLAPGTDPAVAHAARLVCDRVAEGRVCLRLEDYAGRAIQWEEGAEPVILPALADWLHRLHDSRLVGRPFEFAPLILDSGPRLYLARYWNYERKLAEQLAALAASPCEGVDSVRLKADLDRLFAHNAEAPDHQKQAAAVAVLRRFCVISGGPGTGKTSTVVRILAALQAQAGATPLRIALSAPTGKAAARVQEAIRLQKQKLDLPPALKAALPETACTLHRLLGARPDSVYFRHHRDNPLPVDVAVVDEASMIDLALMAKLVDALPPRARLILLGDKDQLAAVEAGSVFGDLCKSVGFAPAFAAQLAGVSGAPVAECDDLFIPELSNCVALLTRSHRFRPDSGIGALARLVNEGRARQAAELLAKGGHADLGWDRGRQDTDLAGRMERGYAEYLAAVEAGAEPREVLRALDRFRVLTAHREGERGVRGANRQFEERLWARWRLRPGTRWYAGRPVIVARNDYDLKLFNGDIGVALPVDGELRVFFEGADGRLRGLAPGRLPEHDTVFAMTVHKSQGSEFDEVLLLLPEAESPVLDRPLVYTAITRAKLRAEIRGAAQVLESAIKRPPTASSGLGERLWR